jgi:RNA polymerase sigma-70 factor (ECF subfamily)
MTPARPSGGHRGGNDDTSQRGDPLDSTRFLLDRARLGDESALDRLCARFIPLLSRWAAGRLPPRARGTCDTADLVQETLVNAIHQLDSFQPEHTGSFAAYLRKAILNRIREEVRKTDRRPSSREIDENHLDLAPSPLEQTIGRETRDRFESAYAELSEDDQALIFLRFELEASHAAVAEALDKPSADAARKAVNRAMVRLAREMSIESG